MAGGPGKRAWGAYARTRAALRAPALRRGYGWGARKPGVGALASHRRRAEAAGSRKRLWLGRPETGGVAALASHRRRTEVAGARKRLWLGRPETGRGCLSLSPARH